MNAFAVLDRLQATIRQRRGADPATSHTAGLLQSGAPRVAKKFGEEAVELAIAAAMQDKQAAIAESADVLFHLLVVWESLGIESEAVMEALAAREGTSGVAEKAARPAR